MIEWIHWKQLVFFSSGLTHMYMIFAHKPGMHMFSAMVHLILVYVLEEFSLFFS